METPQQRLIREIREVEQALRGLFAMDLDDGQLRQGMEEMATRWAFPGLIALWGPGLYYRNRTVFRPFILARFPQFTVDTRGRPKSVFQGPTAELFEKWLQDVERSGDVELFRRLYRLQLQDLAWDARRKRWLGDLLARYGAASTRTQRQLVLNQFDFAFELDEPAAITLYTADAVVSRVVDGVRVIDDAAQGHAQHMPAGIVHRDVLPAVPAPAGGDAGAVATAGHREKHGMDSRRQAIDRDGEPQDVAIEGGHKVQIDHVQLTVADPDAPGKWSACHRASRCGSPIPSAQGAGSSRFPSKCSRLATIR